MHEKAITFEPRANLDMAVPSDWGPAATQVPPSAAMSGRCRMSVMARGGRDPAANGRQKPQPRREPQTTHISTHTHRRHVDGSQDRRSRKATQGDD